MEIVSGGFPIQSIFTVTQVSVGHVPIQEAGLQTLYCFNYVLVHSHLDYCNMLYIGLHLMN